VRHTSHTSRRRRVALRCALILIAWPALTNTAGTFEPANATLPQLRAALDAREISSAQLVQFYLRRIERFNKAGERINAMMTLNPKALEQARARDADAARGARRGPLDGIPFIVKDNFDTAGIPTTGGSAALRHSVPASNAFVVQRLLDAGAILLGKTNMSELAASYGRLGYSSAGGLTLNPYNTRRNASGSSSGSAAGVAADFAPFSLGTDASGSIRAPASVTGLVGLRPTLGLLSRSGVMPSALSFDTPGIMARTVADLAIVLDVIAAEDAGDAATIGQPERARGFVSALAAPSLKGMRLGVVTNFRGGNPEVDAVEQAAFHALESQGAILETLRLPEAMEQLWDSVLVPVSEAEFKPQFERYLRSLPTAQPRTLAQLIRLSAAPAIANSATPMNPARLESLRVADATNLTDSAAYIRLLSVVMPDLRRQLHALLDAHGLQALVFSTMSCPASPRFDIDDPGYLCRSDDPYRASYLGSVTGFPEITAPAGRVSGQMPVGISFLGTPYSEASLLALAAAFEAAQPARTTPQLR
jgi:amidase